MGTSWIDGLQLRMTHREIRMTILNDLQFSISGEILEVTTFGKMLGYVDMRLDDGISWKSNHYYEAMCLGCTQVLHGFSSH